MKASILTLLLLISSLLTFAQKRIIVRFNDLNKDEISFPDATQKDSIDIDRYDTNEIGIVLSDKNLFLGYTNQEIEFSTGLKKLRVLYNDYPGYKVIYDFEILVGDTLLEIVNADYRFYDCLHIPNDEKLKFDNWKKQVLSNKMIIRTNNVFIIQLIGSVKGFDDCLYSLNYGRDRYLKLKINTIPQEAEVIIDRIRVGKTPKSVLIKKQAFGDKVSLQLTAIKEGYYNKYLTIEFEERDSTNLTINLNKK